MIPLIRTAAQWRAVRHRVDLVQLAHSILGPPASKSGNASFWCCPFHGGTDCTLQVVEKRSLWKCRSGEWGDALDLVRRVDNLSFSRALAFLSDTEFFRDEEDGDSGSMVDAVDRGGYESIPVGDEDWIDQLLAEGGSE